MGGMNIAGKRLSERVVFLRKIKNLLALRK